MRKYNEIIKESNIKLTKTVENVKFSNSKILLSIKYYDETTFSAQTRKYLEYPRYMFYYDASFILIFVKHLDCYNKKKNLSKGIIEIY